MRTIKLNINAGEHTCFSEPGKPCQFVRCRKFGQVYFCQIFDELAEDENGWLLRHSDCLKLDTESTDFLTACDDLLRRAEELRSTPNTPENQKIWQSLVTLFPGSLK